MLLQHKYKNHLKSFLVYHGSDLYEIKNRITRITVHLMPQPYQLYRCF